MLASKSPLYVIAGETKNVFGLSLSPTVQTRRRIRVAFVLGANERANFRFQIGHEFFEGGWQKLYRVLKEGDTTK